MYVQCNSALVLTLWAVANSWGYAQENTDAGQANRFKDLVDQSVTPLLTGKNALSGLVVGVVDGDHKEVWGYGKVGADARTPDGETLFGILSVTKPLTALLLAQLSVEGKLAYDEEAIRFHDKPVTFRQ